MSLMLYTYSIYPWPLDIAQILRKREELCEATQDLIKDFIKALRLSWLYSLTQDPVQLPLCREKKSKWM